MEDNIVLISELKKEFIDLELAMGTKMVVSGWQEVIAPKMSSESL